MRNILGILHTLSMRVVAFVVLGGDKDIVLVMVVVLMVVVADDVLVVVVEVLVKDNVFVLVVKLRGVVLVAVGHRV